MTALLPVSVCSSAQRWFALAVPIQFALGAAFAGEGRATEANEHYLAAEIAATEGEKSGDPTCARLRVQARMARGGLLVGIRQFAPAAQLFVETIPLAVAVGDPRMVFDCHRLACFSYEQRQGLAAAERCAGQPGAGRMRLMPCPSPRSISIRCSASTRTSS